MECDIVIPVWNLMETTKRCVESIIRHTEYPYRLIIIDNGSNEPTKSYLQSLLGDKRISKITVFRNEKNLGAAPAFNQGMKMAKGNYILLLNNDTIVTSGWLKEMIRAIESDERVGIVNPDSNNLGTNVPKGILMDDFVKKHIHPRKGEYVEIPCAVGFCYLMKRQLIDDIGIWSQEYESGNYEETEHCILARKAGFKMLVAKGAYVYHQVHATFKVLTTDKEEFNRIFESDKKKFENKYGTTKRVFFLVSGNGQNNPESLSSIFYSVASKGVWVNAIMRKELQGYNFKKHGWVKLFFWSNILFIFRALLKTITKKKKYDVLVVPANYFRIFKTFKFMHKAKVLVFGDNQKLDAFLDK